MKKKETLKEQKKRKIRNRNPYKVELLVDNSIVVFPPKTTVEVPANFDIPSNLGLYNV